MELEAVVKYKVKCYFNVTTLIKSERDGHRDLDHYLYVYVLQAQLSLMTFTVASRPCLVTLGGKDYTVLT